MDWKQICELGSVFRGFLFVLLALLNFHQFMYSRSPKYYFRLLSLHSKQRDTKWSITAAFRVNIEVFPSMYQNLEQILSNKYRHKHYSRRVNLLNKKVYECGSLLLIIYDDSDMGAYSEGRLWVNIPQLNVTIGNARDYLREIRELFHEIEKQIKPEANEYSMDIFFSRKNPFYGLMIQRLGEDNIEYFECKFPISTLIKREYEPETKNYYLRVFKEKITINEASFDAIEETAARALLLR